MSLPLAIVAASIFLMLNDLLFDCPTCTFFVLLKEISMLRFVYLCVTDTHSRSQSYIFENKSFAKVDIVCINWMH